MYKNKTIAVVVPAYNEEKLISKTINTIPNFVDRIIVIDDKSKDNTTNIVKSLQKNNDRLILIKHDKNKGVGKAIKTGYKKALDLEIDITAVMAGDAQMDPDQLSKLLDPIIEKRADYTKGNRLLSRDLKKMPKTRQRGNAVLTILTKVSSGYWNIMDPQNGYTAASKQVLETLVNEQIYLGYGYCNDILVKLNIYNFKVMDVVMPPKYGEEVSGIKLRKYVPKLSWLLLKQFFFRINKKYGGINFHPLLLFFYFGLLLFTSGVTLGAYLVYNRILIGEYSIGTVVLTSLLLTVGLQLLLFAMLFDEMSTKYYIIEKKIKNNKKGFLSRIIHDYWGINFHPLLLFFVGGMILFTSGLFMGGYVLFLRISGYLYSSGTIILVVLLITTGLQLLLFSMLFDYENNQE